MSILPEEPDQQQIMQAFQQKIGNIELTLNALLGVLTEKDVVDQDEVNEKAQEIVQEIQEERGGAPGGPGGQGGGPGAQNLGE